MRGLPYSATEKDVCKFFSPISPTRVVIEYNRAGRPSGNAHADFMNEMDAKDAMKRHRAMMGERYIELSLNGMEYGGFRR
jgi:RNA recognition motif-containing protein